MEKQTIYIMSLEETMDGKYYEVATGADFEEAEKAFLEYAELKNYSDDLEVQYIDGCLSGRATDYIKEMLELAEEMEESIEIVGEIFNSICNIEETRRCLEDKNYSIYSNTLNGHYQTKDDIFESYIDDIDFLSNVPENIKSYIDYSRIRRDFEIEGMEIIEYGAGYIVVNHY